MKVTEKKTTTRAASAKSEEPAIDLEEQVRRRAYELYERRGREHGHEVEDWLQAEAELAAERNTPLPVAAIKAARKPPVTSAGKTKTKQIKKLRSAAQTKED